MNNNSINLQSSGASEPSKAQQNTSVLKLVVFGIGSLTLALPIEFVNKVVNQTRVYSSGLNHMGIAHLGDSEITIIDLHRRLFKSEQTSQSGKGSYLIITKNTLGEIFGIPVTETPALMDLPLSLIRVLPESYRRADTLEIASHVAVIPQETEPLTVFLLDVDRLLPTFSER